MSSRPPAVRSATELNQFQSFLAATTFPPQPNRNFDGSLKWRIGQRDFFDQGYSMYALTGATYNMAKNTLRIDEKGNRYKMGDVITARPILPPADDEFVNQFGWLLGLGAQAAWGRTNVFAEVRYSRVGKDPYNLAHVPVVFGVAFY